MNINNSELVNSSQVPVVEFVDYEGDYPNLCCGKLTIKINGEIREIEHALRSGGAIWFDDGDEHVEYGPWELFPLPEDIEHLHDEILEVVRENVACGCCGGCI